MKGKASGLKLRGRLDYRFLHPSEKLAADYLESLGHTLLRHNYRSRRTEIDLITYELSQKVFHFVEVKGWIKHNLYHPLQSIPLRTVKRRKLLALEFVGLLQGESSSTGRSKVISEDSAALKKIRNIVSVNDYGYPSMSFDLVWIRDDFVEYFEGVF